MTPLIIIGHPYSNYHSVETTLHTYGMNNANDSRREQLSPVTINEKLLKTKGIVFDNNTDIQQIEPVEIWNELALDLLIANIDQALWGWSDPCAILTLEYWKKVQPKIKFIFVYDTPEQIFTAIFKNRNITEKKLEQEITHWNAYYEELLYFYQRNQENCLLVHIGAVTRDLSTFIKASSDLTDYSLEATLREHTIIPSEEKNIQADLLLMSKLLKDFASIHASYERLQDFSSIPLFDDEELSPIEITIEAWNNTYELNDNVTSSQQTKNMLVNERENELKEENELLLLQLHQVREELEYYYLENQKIKNEPNPHDLPEKTGQHFYYGAGDRIKQQLSYRLGAKMIEQSRTISGIVTMPLALAKETKQFHSKNNNENLPPLSEYQDAYEVDRIKQHLSYRLGHTMLQNKSSVIGWIKLPWLLRKDIVDFQKRRKI